MEKKIVGKKNIKKIGVGILGIVVIFFTAFEYSPKSTNAQLAPFLPLQVSCEPSDDVVFINTPVTWTSTVLNATSSIFYAWQGQGIQPQNSRTITATYSSIGEKTATSTVTSNGMTVSAACEVVVIPTVTIPGGGGSGSGGGTPTNPGGGSGSGGGTPTNPGGGSGSGGGTPTNPTNPTNPGGGGSTPANPTTNPTSPTTNPAAKAKDPYEFSQVTPSNAAANQAQQAAVATCKEGSETAKTARTAIQQTPPTDLAQQMVPVNPIPIVKPIQDIDANIKILAQKEIGRADAASGGQTPALDQVNTCTIDDQIAKAIEGAVAFLYKGNAGGPTFIVNYTNHFITRQDKAFEQTIKQLQSSSSCKKDAYKAVADALYKQRNSGGYINSKPQASQASCQVDQSGVDPNDLNERRSLLNYSDPRNNFAILHLGIEEEVEAIQTANTLELAYESNIADGHYNIINQQTGDITDPASIIYPQAIQKLMLATLRFMELDEEGEDGKIIKMYFEKVYQQQQQQAV